MSTSQLGREGGRWDCYGQSTDAEFLLEEWMWEVGRTKKSWLEYKKKEKLGMGKVEEDSNGLPCRTFKAI